jgi:hypothetical protein
MKKVHIKNIAKLIELRKILDKELYSGHALITYDLMLDVLRAYLEGRELTIKELCTGSIRSALNTRKHINLLIDDGWVVLTNGVHDKRQRIVIATDQLIHLADNLLDVGESIHT